MKTMPLLQEQLWRLKWLTSPPSTPATSLATKLRQREEQELEEKDEIRPGLFGDHKQVGVVLIVPVDPLHKTTETK